MAWLEFELAYYDCAVQLFNHYTPGTPPDSPSIYYFDEIYAMYLGLEYFSRSLVAF